MTKFFKICELFVAYESVFVYNIASKSIKTAPLGRAAGRNKKEE